MSHVWPLQVCQDISTPTIYPLHHPSYLFIFLKIIWTFALKDHRVFWFLNFCCCNSHKIGPGELTFSETKIHNNMLQLWQVLIRVSYYIWVTKRTLTIRYLDVIKFLTILYKFYKNIPMITKVQWIWWKFQLLFISYKRKHDLGWLVSYDAVKPVMLWLLQVGVSLGVRWGYSTATVTARSYAYK